MEKQIIIDQLLNENNGSYKDLAEDAYDAGYQAALSQVKNTCTCTQGKGLDHDEHGKQYCIDCGNYTKSAVQGYREALEKILTKRIDELNAADVEFCKDRWERPEIHPLQKAMAREESNKVTFARQELQSILSKVQALSKAEDKGDVKKDFVQWLEEDGLPASRSILAELKALNAAKEATPQPTNSLDELERWAQKGMVKSTLGIIAGDKYTLGYNGALTDLLTKIQSLKQNPKP